VYQLDVGGVAEVEALARTQRDGYGGEDATEKGDVAD
jgi:hypothetical protein